jgi:hypothetical protein
LYRTNKDGKLVDSELVFEPADPITGITVESSYEAKMIQYLVGNNRNFYKPLVGNVTELFLDFQPDMVLKDSNPTTIIEVAGYQKEEYRNHLKIKEVSYTERGYHYIEWDGDTDINKVILPVISE